MVRNRRIRPGGHDGFERGSVGAVVEHQHLQVTGHGALGAAGPQPAALHQCGQRGVGGLAGQPEQRHLAGVLDLAQRLHGAGGPNQIRGGVIGQRAGQRVQAVDGDDVAFESDPPGAAGQGQLHEMTAAGPLDHSA